MPVAGPEEAPAASRGHDVELEFETFVVFRTVDRVEIDVLLEGESPGALLERETVVSQFEGAHVIPGAVEQFFADDFLA